MPLLSYAAAVVEEPSRNRIARAYAASMPATMKNVDVSEILLNALLGDRDFLAGSSMSEEGIARVLNVKRGTAREAFIAFTRQSWLIRTQGGLARPDLKPSRLKTLIGHRLLIERKAVRAIVLNPNKREIISDLRPLLKTASYLSSLAEGISNENVDDEQFLHAPTDSKARSALVNWTHDTIGFHVDLVRAAGFPDLADTLIRILLLIRIGARMRFENKDQRETANGEHQLLLDKIERSDVWSSELDLFVRDHIKRSWVRALETWGESESAKDWTEILESFEIPPGV